MVGEELVVPDQGLQELAQGLVLVEDVEGDAARLHQVLDLADRVEQAADVGGHVDLPEQALDLLFPPLEPEVADLEGDAFLELPDDVVVDEALDLADLRVDLVDAVPGGFLGGEILDLGFEAGPVEGEPELAEVSLARGLVGGEGCEIDVVGGGPAVDRAAGGDLVAAGDEDGGAGCEVWRERREIGEKRVHDEDGRRGERGERGGIFDGLAGE